MAELLPGLLGALVGLVLGCTGAGGGALAVPALIVLLGWPASQAVPTSLLAVGMAALAASVGARRSASHSAAAAHAGPDPAVQARLVPDQRRGVLLLALPGLLGASAALRMHPYLPAWLPLSLLGMLALWLAWRAWWPQAAHGAAAPRAGTRPGSQASPRWPLLAAIGLVCGTAGGLLGIGGGFLLVPALQRWGAQADPRAAMTLSLRVIAIISLAGWAGALPGSLLLPDGGFGFVGATLLGLLAGRRLSARWSGRTLQRTFTALLLGITVFACFAPPVRGADGLSLPPRPEPTEGARP